MNDKKGLATVKELLELTEGRELDCEEFQSFLAAWLEGNVDDELAALLHHHELVCPECAEERAILARALGLDGC